MLKIKVTSLSFFIFNAQFRVQCIKCILLFYSIELCLNLDIENENNKHLVFAEK